MKYLSRFALAGGLCLGIFFVIHQQYRSPNTQEEPISTHTDVAVAPASTSPEAPPTTTEPSPATASGSHHHHAHPHGHGDCHAHSHSSTDVPAPDRATSKSVVSVEERLQLSQRWDQPSGYPSIDAFATWTQKYLEAKTDAIRSSLVEEGITLAEARRPALKSLIQVDPEQALQRSIPMEMAAQLPEDVVALLETRVEGRGDLDVFCVHPGPERIEEGISLQRKARFGDREYDTFVHGQRHDHPTGRDMPMHGIAMDDVLALSENPVRLMDPQEAKDYLATRTGELICDQSSRPIGEDDHPVMAMVGGTPQVLLSFDQAGELNDDLVLAASNGTGTLEGEFPVGRNNYTEGRKRLIIFRVAFPNVPTPAMSEQQGLNLIENANNYLSRVSYGRVSVAPAGEGSDVVVVTLANNSSTYDGSAGSLRNDVRSTAAASGIDLSQYDFDITAVGGTPAFSWAGLGFVGAPGSWLANGAFGTGVTVHELGHNLGFPHGNYWDTDDQSDIGPGGNQEYGDPFDVMGGGGSGSGDYCIKFKNRADWVTDEDYPMISASGTYRLFAHDNQDSTGVRGLRVNHDGNRVFSLSFRQRYTGNPWMMRGVGVRWGSGSTQSQLVDTTPGSDDNKNDAPVVIGRTWSNYEADTPFHLTPVRLGNTYPQSIDVNLQFGDFPGNQSPTVRIIADATSTGTGSPLTFRAEAIDPDGDELAYYWEYGNGDFGENSDTVTHSWSSSGEYVVRVTASDMKGGTASTSILVTIGSPSTFTISGRILDDGQPVEGVLVMASGSRYAYTDSDGSYTISRLNSGSYTITATLYPLSFTHPWFSNPVTVGPDATGIDFLAVDAAVDDAILIAEDAVWK